MLKTITNQREKILIRITAAVIIAVLLYNLIIGPQRVKQRQYQQQRQELELNLRKLQADFQIKDQTEALYQRIAPMLRCDQSDQQAISYFTRQLNEIYNPLALTIQSVKILPLIRDTHTRKLFIRIEIKGKVKQVITFISQLSKHPEPIKIEQFQLQATDIAEVIHTTFLISKIVGPKG